MKCTEPMTLAELQSMVSVGTWSDDALQIVLDASVDFLFALLGHSFGRAIRIYHDGLDEEVTAVTVEVTATKIILIITGGDDADTYEYALAEYDDEGELEAEIDMVEIIDSIEQEDVGFVVTLVEGMSPTEPPTNLHTLDAIDCLTLSARQVLCISQTTEVMDGTGTGYIFTNLPIRSLEELLQDGTDITDYAWAKTGGYVLYKYCSGSQYQKYSLDLFSLKAPCNIVICYIPLWLRIPGFFKLILRAMCQFTLNSSGYTRESIGDYSYSLGDISGILAPWWPMMAEYMISFQP